MPSSQAAHPRRKGKRAISRKEESCEDRCTRTRLVSAALELIWSCSYGATSVDAICEKAGARKGSFYYFFPSKSALAVEALEEHWRRRSVVLGEFFAPSVPPLERLKRYFDEVRRQQALHQEAHGMVLGCPLFSIGCEVCTQDRAIGDKVQELLERYIAYFEQVITDAASAGMVDVPDIPARARAVFSYYEGVLAQARIQNSLGPLDALEKGVADLLGGAPHRKLFTSTPE